MTLDRDRARAGQAAAGGLLRGVEPETLVIAGGKSSEYMRNSQAAIADAVPRARLETLAGQTHMVKAKVVAPAVSRFCWADRASPRIHCRNR